MILALPHSQELLLGPPARHTALLHHPVIPDRLWSKTIWPPSHIAAARLSIVQLFHLMRPAAPAGGLFGMSVMGPSILSEESMTLART